MAVILYLLRHAETEYNAAGDRIGGRSDALPLSQQGFLQAKAAGLHLQLHRMTFDQIFCSTAVRARQTLAAMQAVYPEVTQRPVIFSDQLREMSQGQWEGRLRAEIYTPEQLEIIRQNNYLFKAPGGESQQDVEERLFGFLDREIATRYTSGRFLLVGHGFSFKCILRRLRHADPTETYRIPIANCAFIPLTYDGTSWAEMPDSTL